MANLMTLYSRLELSTDGFQRGIEQAERQAQKFSKSAGGSFSGFARTALGALGLGTGVAGAVMALRKAMDFGREGENLRNLGRSFELMAERAGKAADEVLADMQRMSQGMMSEAELMQRYNQTALLAGPEMAAESGRMLRIAMASAAAGMGDLNYLMESLTLGIGRQSKIIIDNLGYTLDLASVYDTYARSLGKTADALTDTEKKMAILNEVERQAEDRMGDLDKVAQDLAGKGFAQLQAAWSDWVDYLKTVASPTLDMIAGKVASIFRGATPGTDEYIMRHINQRLDPGAIDQAFRIAQSAGPRGGAVAAMTREELLEQQVRALAKEMDLASLSAEEWTYAYGLVEQQSARVATVFMDLRQAAVHAHNEQQAWINTAKRLMGVTEDLSEATDETAASFETAAEAAQRYSSMLDQLGGSLEEANRQARSRLGAKELGLTNAQGEPITWAEPWLARDTIADLTPELPEQPELPEEKVRNFGSAISDAQQAWESLVSSWQSGVDAILQPTQGFDLDNILDQMGMHRDKWDEPARRMASIMNEGSASEWFASMGSQWAGLSEQAIKGNAANWIASFYRGDMPTEINWGAFDAALQEQMSRQANWEKIKQMAYARAEAMGLGPNSGLVMSAFGQSGIGGALGSGAAMAADVTEGFRGVAEPQWERSGFKDAEAYYGAFSGKFGEADWAKLGTAAGEAIKGGILDAAREAGSKFLDELAQVVSPYVAKHLADNKEYTPG